MALELRATQSLINIRREPRRFAYWYEAGNATILASAFFDAQEQAAPNKFLYGGKIDNFLYVRVGDGMSTGERIR